MKKLTRRLVGLLPLAVMVLPWAANAQDYPARPVKIVVPYPPGSSPDALARIISEQLSRAIKQTVVVENKPGAAGMIGAKSVSEAAPDGSTLLMYTPAWPATKIFVKKPAIAVPEGLEPVTLVAEGRFAFVGSGALAATNFSELMAHAKANPGKLNFATTGPGDALLYFETLKAEKEIKVETIQYKGSSQYLTALMANEVQLGFPPDYTTLPLVRDGKLKAYALTGDKRSSAYPNVPTFKELGLPNIRGPWMALFAPRGTPAALVNKLNADLTAIIKSTDGSKRIQDISFEPVGSSAEQLRRRVQNDIEQWSVLAKKIGIEAE